MTECRGFNPRVVATIYRIPEDRKLAQNGQKAAWMGPSGTPYHGEAPGACAGMGQLAER